MQKGCGAFFEHKCDFCAMGQIKSDATFHYIMNKKYTFEYSHKLRSTCPARSLQKGCGAFFDD